MKYLVLVLSLFVLVGCQSVATGSLNIPVKKKSVIYALGKDKTINKIEFTPSQGGKTSYTITSLELEYSSDVEMYIGDLKTQILDTLEVKNLYSSYEAKLSTLQPLCSSNCGGLEQMYLSTTSLEKLYKSVEEKSASIPSFAGGGGSGGAGGSSGGNGSGSGNGGKG